MYEAGGIRFYRGICSRSGEGSHKLVRGNRKVSVKCGCTATLTMSDNGVVVFTDDHSEYCLPDPNIENDGYVFNSGLSPSTKSSIVSNISNLLSDHGTTAAVARRQIESALVRSGDTGFGSG